jgi:hypothetical protein
MHIELPVIVTILPRHPPATAPGSAAVRVARLTTKENILAAADKRPVGMVSSACSI